jgi:hypothetical protein
MITTDSIVIKLLGLGKRKAPIIFTITAILPVLWFAAGSAKTQLSACKKWKAKLGRLW